MTHLSSEMYAGRLFQHGSELERLLNKAGRVIKAAETLINDQDKRE